MPKIDFNIPDISGPTVRGDQHLRDILIAQRQMIKDLVDVVNSGVSGQVDVVTHNFKPVIADSVVGGNIGTFSGQSFGISHRVGNLVTLSIRLVNLDPTGLTLTSNIHIRGFPYSSSSRAMGGCYLDGLNFGGTNSFIQSFIGIGNKYILLLESQDNASGLVVTYNYLTGTNDTMTISLSYLTNDPV